MENVIEVKNLIKKFGDFNAVDNIGFEVKKGEFFGFLGVNGAGKSTTINMLCNLYKKTSGKITICGLNIDKDSHEISKKIGIVFQENTLDDRLTVKENLISRAYLYSSNSKEIKENIKYVVNVLQLEDVYNRKFGSLSGGQKRRCEIARALVHRPEILFLDEPTTGLDPKTRQMVWECVDYLRKEDGMTIFLTTHYMEEAAKADHIVILDKGKILADTTPFMLKEKYTSDRLKVEAIDHEEVSKIIESCDIDAVYESNCIVINVPSSINAIPLLEKLKNSISAFEVVQGTMEDAFLNITGKKLEEV